MLKIPPLRTRWLPHRTPLLSLGALGLVLLIYAMTIENFLAITRPVNGEILVVESWYAAEPTLGDAVTAIRQGNYKKILCVAMTSGSEAEEGAQDGAARAAHYLTAKGVDPGIIQVLNVPYAEKHQTYSSALAARIWLLKEFPELKSIDVFTKSIHARKSLMLFQKAFPQTVRIGIIAGSQNPYRHTFWWLSRRGLFVVTKNTIGYFYALTFSPPPPPSHPKPQPHGEVVLPR